MDSVNSLFTLYEKDKFIFHYLERVYINYDYSCVVWTYILPIHK